MTTSSSSADLLLARKDPESPLTYRKSREAASLFIKRYLETLHSQNLSLSESETALVSGFLTSLIATRPEATLSQIDDDNYHDEETVLRLSELLTWSVPTGFHVGTGLSVIELLASQIITAKHEVLFVTCFWADSESRTVLAEALRELNRRHAGGAAASGGKLRVRIGFSSSSPWQKLFHTASPKGKVYPPSLWAKKLGLPTEEELGNLDLEVKSIFYLPFSVLHGKFCVVDREKLWLPSANVSWEVWGECCASFEGGIVDSFVKFWGKVWDPSGEYMSLKPNQLPQPTTTTTTTTTANSYPTLFLPHPHHRNPRFSLPTPLTPCIPHNPTLAPATPQNTFLLHAITTAKSSIYLQTPNITSEPLLSAIQSSVVNCGITVEIVTCRKMMLTEQLVTTAGAGITETCVAQLISRISSSTTSRGVLRVWYYTGAGAAGAGEESPGIGMAKAVKSHVKALIVDGNVTVLGSANADRASWFTSQEVNVAVFGEGFARGVRRGLVQGLGGRLEFVGCGGGNLELEA